MEKGFWEKAYTAWSLLTQTRYVLEERVVVQRAEVQHAGVLPTSQKGN